MNNLNSKLKKLIESDKFKKVLRIVGVLAVFFFIFQAGVFVGFRKASFFCDWGDNYKRNFGEPRDAFRGMMKRDIPNAHGTVGRVVSVSLPSVFVADNDGTEKMFFVGDKTLVRRFRDNIKAEEIAPNDNVVVFGFPRKDGSVEATLIRVMPSINKNTSTTSSNIKIR